MPITMYSRVVMSGSLQGQTCQTKLFYYLDSSIPFNAGGFAGAFRTTVWDDMKAHIDESFRLDTITVRQGLVGTGSYQDFQLVVNETGLVTGADCMPAWVTVSIWKQPDNATIEPAGESDFGNSHNGFSGIPESSCADGLLTSAALSDWNDVGEAMEEVIVGANTWGLGIHRQGSTTPPITPAYVYVLETYASQKLGSQLRRKY